MALKIYFTGGMLSELKDKQTYFHRKPGIEFSGLSYVKASENVQCAYKEAGLVHTNKERQSYFVPLKKETGFTNISRSCFCRGQTSCHKTFGIMLW